MRVTIVAVGLRQPEWADAAVRDYLARFPKDWPVTLKEVKAEPRSGQSTAKLMQAEAERILKAVPAGDILVALDEHGRDLTTMDFARRLEGWQNEGAGVAFVIGGADGLDAALKAKARNAVSVRQNLGYLRREYSAAEGEFVPHPRLFAGTCYDLPSVKAFLIEQKELNNRSRVVPRAVHSGREHLCVVENKAVAGLEILGYIPENTVSNFTRFFVHNEQP